MNPWDMRTTWTVLTGLLIAGAVAGAYAQDDPAPKIPAPDFTGMAKHKVADVIDGNTVSVEIDGKPTVICLIGVDTPESAMPSGRHAARFLENLLTGESVYLVQEPGRERDFDGHKLAYLYRAPHGRLVNLEIVRQGYGRVYAKIPFEHMALFAHYERAAREAKKGVWGPDGAGSFTSRSAGKPPPPALTPRSEKPPADVSADDSDGDTTVYATRTRTKYHRGSCSYLRKSKIPVSLKQARERSLKPCSRCKP